MYLPPQYNPATRTMSVSQNVGWTPAQYQPGAIQYGQYGQAGSGLVSGDAQPQFNQTQQVRFLNPAQEQGLQLRNFSAPQLVPTRFNKMQSLSGSNIGMMYRPQGGVLNTPQPSFKATPNQAVS